MYGYEIFHDNILTPVIDAVRDGRNPHAWIFVGEDGIGKHNCASLVSAAVTCLKRESAPCGICKSCIMAKAETHPDIKKVVPLDNKKSIGVEVIRSVNDDVFIKPFFSDYKVYIIEGDLLTAEAQNAFLKTLEEPPLYAVFIILTTKEDNLLQTIKSRCGMIKFPPLSPKQMEQYLRSKYPELENNYKLYINFSNGNPGVADKIIGSGELDILRSDCFECARKVLSAKTDDAFEVSAFFDKNKDKLDEILEILLLFFSDLNYLMNGFTDKIINVDYLSRMREKSVNVQRLIKAIDTISVCCEMNKRNVSAKHIGTYLALTVKTDRKGILN